MFESDKRNLVRAVLKTAGLRNEKIAKVLAMAEDQEPKKGELQPLLVNQARTAELLFCSRFHVRKLEKLGLLKPVDLAGLKRYAVADVLRLAGGNYDS